MLNKQDLRNILIWFDCMQEYIKSEHGRIGKTHHNTEAKVLKYFHKK